MNQKTSQSSASHKKQTAASNVRQKGMLKAEALHAASQAVARLARKFDAGGRSRSR